MAEHVVLVLLDEQTGDVVRRHEVAMVMVRGVQLEILVLVLVLLLLVVVVVIVLLMD